jgi:hypothetical protein
MLVDAYDKVALKKTQVYEWNETAVSAAWQYTCTLVIGGRKVPCHAQCDSLGTFSIFPGLVTTRLFTVSANKTCFERTALRKSLQKLWDHWQRYWKIVSRNVSKKLHDHWQKCTSAQGNYFEWNVM